MTFLQNYKNFGRLSKIEDWLEADKTEAEKYQAKSIFNQWADQILQLRCERTQAFLERINSITPIVFFR